MTFPDRTYETITLPGSSRTTRYLSTPVDGGAGGSATPDTEQYIVSFVATENTGVATVLVEPGEQGLTDEQLLELLAPRVEYYNGDFELVENPTFVAGEAITIAFYFNLENVPGATGATVRIIEEEFGMTNFETWEYSDEEGYEDDYMSATNYAIFGSGNPDLNTEDVTAVPSTRNGATAYGFDGPEAGTYDFTIAWAFDQLSTPFLQTATATFTAE